MLLDDIQAGDLVVLENGDQAFIMSIEKCSDRLYIVFGRNVLGVYNKSMSWSYSYSGRLLGGGNNIVKVIHADGD